MLYGGPKLEVKPFSSLIGVTERSSCYYLFQRLLCDYKFKATPYLWGVGSQVKSEIIRYIYHSLSSLLGSGIIFRQKDGWGVGDVVPTGRVRSFCWL